MSTMTCRNCGEHFKGPECLHEYVTPVCPCCGSEDSEEKASVDPQLARDMGVTLEDLK